MKLFNLPLFYCVIAVAAASCGAEPETQVYEHEQTDSVSVDYERELRSVRKDIRDAGNLYLILREIEVPYNNELVLPASKYVGANSRRKQALSLGAAGADLNYITMFEQQSEAAVYVKTILDLAASLGMQSAFDESVMKAIVDPADTTASFQERSKMLTEAYQKAEEHLYAEERAQLTAIIVAGGWMESMYIASSIGASIESQREVDAEIWNMIFGADKVVKMLDMFEDDADCAAVAADIRSVEPLLRELKEMPMQDVHARFGQLSAVMKTLRSKML